MYPLPSTPTSVGRSQRILAYWMKKSSIPRDKVVIAGAVCGRSPDINWCRKDQSSTRINRQQVFESVDTQLKRLETDYLDLLNIHWPDRYVRLFGDPNYNYTRQVSDAAPFEEQLEIMQELIASGKIRAFGVSNETPYGLTSFVRKSEESKGRLPRVCCIQNAYNLLNRHEFEITLEEACSPVNLGIGLVAYSPLGGGCLSGKYLRSTITSKIFPKILEDSRLHQFIGFQNRYLSEYATEATKGYKEISDELGYPLAALALAWVYTRPFVSSTIISATNAAQLEDNFHALNIPMVPEIANKIDAVYRKYPDPTREKFEFHHPDLDMNIDREYISESGETTPNEDVRKALDVVFFEKDKFDQYEIEQEGEPSDIDQEDEVAESELTQE